MGDKTGIHWTDASWNPVTGCTKVSQGCKNCYAETVAQRYWARQYAPREDGTPRRFTDVELHPDRLELPLRWKRPRRIFVNSMSDLFHEAVPVTFIARVFAVMAAAQQHTFQILTKRPERMAALFADPLLLTHVDTFMGDRAAERGWCLDEVPEWPLKNVWLGASVERQQEADARIPHLIATPAAVRFLSCEPLLGPIDFDRWWAQHDRNGEPICYRSDIPIHWVIAGGESGPAARPMDPSWARSLRDQCNTADVPFFFKQSSGIRPGMHRELDGRLWEEFPAVTELETVPA